MINRSRNCGRLFLAFILAGCAALAGPINPDTWYQFSFTDAGIEARGCDPEDPAGGFCVPSSGTLTTNLDAPPWTFTALAGGNLLTVVDAFVTGDQFEVFDFGVSIGLTSAPADGDCGDDPVPCLTDPNASKGGFLLAPGDHSISIVPVLSPGGGGSAYLFVAGEAVIPEPGIWILFGSGLLAVFLKKLYTSRL